MEKINLEDIIINHSFDGMLITDGKGKVIICTKNMREDLCLSEEEISNISIYDIFKLGHYPISTTIKALETKKPCTGLIGINGKNGDIMSTSKPILDENGDVKYVITNSRQDNLLEYYAKELDEKKKRLNQYENITTYLNNINNQNELIAYSHSIKKILAFCDNLSMSDSVILLTGESGVGKEVIAKYIHDNSLRNREPFIPVNCGAIPNELMESEFFGYNKGAYTGANPKGGIGLFEMADKGTLFLDEIGDLPYNMQPKLLRVLETHEIKKVGSSEYKKINVRIIAATNRDLKNLIKEKLFREDLYYRLNVIPIEIPPLREREEDIIPLAEFFLEKFNKKYCGNKTISSEMKNSFLDYNWPGNIRELRNQMERLMFIDSNTLPENSSEPESFIELQKEHTIGEISSNLPLKEAMRIFEYQYIQKVLESCEGKIGESAKVLGIHRTHLYKKLNK